MKVCEPVLPAGSSYTSVPTTHLTESFGNKDGVIYRIFYNPFPASTMQLTICEYNKMAEWENSGKLEGRSLFYRQTSLRDILLLYCPSCPSPDSRSSHSQGLHLFFNERPVAKGRCPLSWEQETSLNRLPYWGGGSCHRWEGRKTWRATNRTQNLLWSSAIWLKMGTLWLMKGCGSPDPWNIPWEMQMCMSRPESCIPQPWADTHMTRACRCLFTPES